MDSVTRVRDTKIRVNVITILGMILCMFFYLGSTTQNLLQNPNAEGGLSYWNFRPTTFYADKFSSSGNYSIAANTTELKSVFANQRVTLYPTTSNARYNISGNIYTSPYAEATIFIRFYLVDGTEYSLDVLVNWTQTFNSWSTFQQGICLSQDIYEASFYIGASFLCSNCSEPPLVYFDDLALEYINSVGIVDPCTINNGGCTSAEYCTSDMLLSDCQKKCHL